MTQLVQESSSPLFFESGDPGYIDNNVQIFRADSAGNLNATFQVPNPFTAAASDAVCPPTPGQVAEGFLLCGLVLANGDGSEGVVVALGLLGPGRATAGYQHHSLWKGRPPPMAVATGSRGQTVMSPSTGTRRATAMRLRST